MAQFIKNVLGMDRRFVLERIRLVRPDLVEKYPELFLKEDVYGGVNLLDITGTSRNAKFVEKPSQPKFQSNAGKQSVPNSSKAFTQLIADNRGTLGALAALVGVGYGMYTYKDSLKNALVNLKKRFWDKEKIEEKDIKILTEAEKALDRLEEK